MARPPLAALFLLLAGACSRGSGGPHWIHLATLPAEVQEDASAAAASGDPARLRLVPEQGGRRLLVSVPRAAWKRDERADAWCATIGLRGAGRPPAGDAAWELTAPGHAFHAVSPTGLVREEVPGPDSFFVTKGRLFLRLAPGEEPPEECTCRIWIETGLRQDGVARVRGRRFSGEGYVVLPGERRELVLDVPPESTLRGAFCVESLHVGGGPGAGLGDDVHFRVLLDGAVLGEGELRPTGPSGSLALEVALPAEGRRGARLAFEVTGRPAFCAFLAPVIGPARRTDEDARRRPDVVVFQADTFRADNMATYGGAEGLTPFLDRLAGESLVLRHAWSVTTYTLAAHASIFSGLYPAQAGITGIWTAGTRLPKEVRTLAGVLAQAGYRTGAVTDGGFVSSRFGFDRSFERFDESAGDLGDTFRRVREFLDADDGRPVFLFVQTYQAHRPYVCSAGTKEALADRLDLARPADELFDRLDVLLAAPATPANEAEKARLVAEVRDHYRAAAAELDRGVERFWSLLEERGIASKGYLLFTSDHGEAFLEHGSMYHCGPVWGEETRIPLLIHGPGIAPRVEQRPASLVDLAPTIARLAGASPPPDWEGTSLFDLAADRPIYLFQCDLENPRSTVAVVEDGRKVIAPEDPEALRAGKVLGAYDLARDPREEHDLSASAGWPAEELARARDQLSRLLRPRYAAEEAELGADERAELEALGYGGH